MDINEYVKVVRTSLGDLCDGDVELAKAVNKMIEVINGKSVPEGPYITPLLIPRTFKVTGRIELEFECEVYMEESDPSISVYDFDFSDEIEEKFCSQTSGGGMYTHDDNPVGDLSWGDIRIETNVEEVV